MGDLTKSFWRLHAPTACRFAASVKGMSDEELLEALCVTARDGEGLCDHIGGTYGARRFPQRYFPRACLSFTVIPGTSKADVSAEGCVFSILARSSGPSP